MESFVPPNAGDSRSRPRWTSTVPIATNTANTAALHHSRRRDRFLSALAACHRGGKLRSHH